eukprot:608000-Hanusia_phi.AAC.1
MARHVVTVYYGDILRRLELDRNKLLLACRSAANRGSQKPSCQTEMIATNLTSYQTDNDASSCLQPALPDVIFNSTDLHTQVAGNMCKNT